MENRYELLIVGAGPGGYAAAEKAAKLGMTVAVIDRGPLGGTCINRGCIPAKAFLYASGQYRMIRDCEKLGLHAENVTYDLRQMAEYTASSSAVMRAKLKQKFQKLNIRFIRGTAQVQPENRVRVEYPDGDTEIYQGNRILIAAGAKAVPGGIPGAELPGVVTSGELLECPVHAGERLLILGGGAVGLEMASAFRNLGAEVTIIEITDRLLPLMDLEFSEKLERLLGEGGVHVYKESVPERIYEERGTLTCTFSRRGERYRTQAERILVAVGRTADTEGLFADGVPVKLDHGRILVDADFQTSVPGIYAVGDVTGGIKLAHVASAEGVYAVERMNDLEPSVKISMTRPGIDAPISVVPRCLYTDPEIAFVGLTEEQAGERGIPVRCGRSDMKGNSRKILSRESGAFIKILFERESDVLLGAQIMCPRATDMIGELTTALANGLTSRQLMYAMRVYPTFSEAISSAVEHSRE